jgi:hypothetical protein
MCRREQWLSKEAFNNSMLSNDTALERFFYLRSGVNQAEGAGAFRHLNKAGEASGL